MPVSRKKSCVQCRAAKARCNLASPCSRCSDRDLGCNYTALIRHQVPTTMRGPDSTPLDQVIESSIKDAAFTSDIQMQDFGFPEDINQDPAALRFEDLGWPTPDWSESNIFHPITNNANSDSFMEMLELPIQTSTPGQAPVSRSRTQSPNFRQSENNRQSGNPLAKQISFIPETSDELVAVYGHVHSNILSPRRSRATQSLLLTQVLWGQIKQYPKIMILGQLPPFIYPACVLDGVLPKNCVLKGIHQCLPEPLTVCAGLVSMFYACTPASSALVQRNIQEEVARLKNEFHSYDHFNLLASFQAITVYALVHFLFPAQDLESQQNDAAPMIPTLMDIGKRLNKLWSPIHNIYKKETLTQREWSFNESMVRTMCLGYVVGKVLDALLDNPRPVECGGHASIPLPGPRTLWEYENSESWAHRLDRYKADRISERTLTLWDLRITGPRRATDQQEVDGETVEAMARWCEEIDEFGSVLWMVSLLEPDRRKTS